MSKALLLTKLFIEQYEGQYEGQWLKIMKFYKQSIYNYIG